MEKVYMTACHDLMQWMERFVSAIRNAAAYLLQIGQQSSETQILAVIRKKRSLLKHLSIL